MDSRQELLRVATRTGQGMPGPGSGLSAAKLTTAPGQVVSRPASKPGSDSIY
jgi:hypothetical protein